MKGCSNILILGFIGAGVLFMVSTKCGQDPTIFTNADPTTKQEPTARGVQKKTKYLPAEAQNEASPIPGLFPVDVFRILKNLDFAIGGPHFTETGRVEWSCKNENQYFDASVFIVSRTATSVDSINCSVKVNPSAPNPGSIAAPILGAVAMAPYYEAQPTQAKAFVEDNINGAGATRIGGVQFRIGGSHSIRTLSIAMQAK